MLFFLLLSLTIADAVGAEAQGSAVSSYRGWRTRSFPTTIINCSEHENEHEVGYINIVFSVPAPISKEFAYSWYGYTCMDFRSENNISAKRLYAIEYNNTIVSCCYPTNEHAKEAIDYRTTPSMLNLNNAVLAIGMLIMGYLMVVFNINF